MTIELPCAQQQTTSLRWNQWFFSQMCVCVLRPLLLLLWFEHEKCVQCNRMFAVWLVHNYYTHIYINIHNRRKIFGFGYVCRSSCIFLDPPHTQDVTTKNRYWKLIKPIKSIRNTCIYTAIHNYLCYCFTTIRWLLLFGTTKYWTWMDKNGRTNRGKWYGINNKCSSYNFRIQRAKEVRMNRREERKKMADVTVHRHACHELKEIIKIIDHLFNIKYVVFR